MTHKYNQEAFTARKQAIVDLKAPHTPPTTVIALRERVTKLEIILGVN